MRSALTKRLFRQLTYNALHSDSSSICQSIRCYQHHLKAHYALVAPSGQTRNLFGFSNKTDKQPSSSRFKPGYELMVLCKERLKSHERPPPPKQLAMAFKELFQSQSKLDGGTLPLEDLQLRAAIPTFKYLQQSYEEAEDFGLSDDNLRMALRALRSGSTSLHVEMATLLFDELLNRRLRAINGEPKAVPLHSDLVCYIWILCHNGRALLARDLVEMYWESDLKDATVPKNGSAEKIPSQWAITLRGLIRERRNSEIEKTLDLMKKYKVPFDNKVHQAIVTFYAFYEEDLDMTKKWYYHDIADSEIPTSFTDATVLKLCIRKDELEWGNSIFTKLVERNPEDKTSWNIILQWCAANGKGVDDIEDMMKIMEERARDRPDLKPGMDTINALIEFANKKDDPYTAERYYALGQKWGFVPNSRTYLLQLDYRIKEKDISGAMNAYKNLQTEAPPEEEDIPYINRLIVALCDQGDQRHEFIMNLVEDLRDRKAPFYSETVKALALQHIKHDEMQDFTDLIRTFVHHYSIDQRMSIRTALLGPLFDKTVDNDSAWTIYHVLQANMPETLDRDLRVEIMQSFFGRKRGDMGLHVFGHMRKDKIAEIRPTLDIYCLCLEGIARHGDEAAVQLVHNMMTMDDDIEPNTKIRNALMWAWGKNDRPAKAEKSWLDIVYSREGPSYNSLRIALIVCKEMGPLGDRLANDIWARIKRMDIEVTRELFAAYIGAMAGAGIDSVCWKMLETVEKDYGFKVDAFILGTYFNSVVGEKELWQEDAKVKYPEAYADLLKCTLYRKTIYDPDAEDLDEFSINTIDLFFDIEHLAEPIKP